MILPGSKLIIGSPNFPANLNGLSSGRMRPEHVVLFNLFGVGRPKESPSDRYLSYNQYSPQGRPPAPLVEKQTERAGCDEKAVTRW